MNRRISTLLVAIMLMMMLGVSMAWASQPQTLETRHVWEAVVNGQAKVIGPMPSAQTMRLEIVLGLRHEPELKNILDELYDPASAIYRQFLTVDEFTARYGASREQYDAVVEFAKANGFKVESTSRNRMNVGVRGTVEVIEKAFHVKMNQYQHPTENRRFYAPDREPTVDLPFQLWRIAGLDNYSKPKPEYVRKDEASTTVKPNAVFGSGPDRSFLGSDMRAAYYGGTTLTGAGQTLGLLEFAGTELSDLKTYYANIGQTINTPIVLLSVDGTSLDCFAWQLCDDTEQTLDMTQALGMAPGLSKLVVYIGSTPDGLLNAMATYDAPPDAQLSSSWSWALSDWTADDPYFEEFAAQGQSFLQAAGDSGSWTENYFPTATPLDSVYVTSVGGTALSTKTAGGAWASEDAWMDSGGGTSRYLRSFGIPSWQVTTAESCLFWCDTTYRNGPDVSAEANFDFYVCADQEGCFTEIGGTSFAAPMWAAFLALINQQAAASGESTIGFANPLLYEIGQGTKYTKAFHDITEGGNGMYVATTGYDLVTGWGSPNGVGLINAMVAGNVTPTVTLSPTSLTFAKTAVGEMSAAKTITLKNTSAGLLNLSKMFASSGFEISSNACGRTLAAKTSCKLTVTFTPSQVGTAMGTITLVDNAANSPQTVTLSGTGK